MKVKVTKRALVLTLTPGDVVSLRQALSAVVRTDWTDSKTRNLGRYLAGVVEGVTGAPVDLLDPEDSSSPVYAQGRKDGLR